ncbi:MAG: SDR family NAD(P)-dependent oxidoreductase [Nitrospira sp.]
MARLRASRVRRLPTPPSVACHNNTPVALITGAGRGIGRATATRFAQAGFRVAICARTASELRATHKTLAASGGQVFVRRADTGKPSDARALVRAVLKHYGHIDVLINNAGILGPMLQLTRYPLRPWLNVLRINLTGTFVITQEVARAMMRRHRGCIITVSSSVGRAGRAGWGAYAVSKFGVEGLSQVLADELRPFNVCVMTYNPGGTRTKMRAQAFPHEDRSKLKDPSVTAEALLRLTRGASPDHTGHAFDAATLPDSPV